MATKKSSRKKSEPTDTVKRVSTRIMKAHVQGPEPRTRKKGISKRDLEFFKSVKILGGLNDDQVASVFRISRKKQFNRGSTIMREGEAGDTMYLFFEGEVEVLNTLTMKFGKHNFEETEKSMVKLDASFVSFFGEMSLLEDAPRSATITAKSDCVLYELRKENFRQLCSQEPAIGYQIVLKIAEVLCSRIRKSNQDILKLTTALSIALSR